MTVLRIRQETSAVYQRGDVCCDEFSRFHLAIGTAVHPDYRDLGVATCLKALDLDRCINDGEKYFESATANPAMQRVNGKLGYRLNGLAEVRFVKTVG